MIKSTGLISVLIFVFSVIYSQQVMNVRSEKSDEYYTVIYDLSGDGPFGIKVYYSLDGGETWSQPVNKVTGAIGDGQKAGSNRKIRWDIPEDQEKPIGIPDFKVEAFSEQWSSEAGTYTDKRDGQSYKWLKIGKQAWMGENLNFNTFPGSWCFDNQISNCSIYGRLYDWKTAVMACPEGWHLPSDAEWTLLTDYLEGENRSGGKLKETGNLHWKPPNTGAIDSIGFSALPAGFRSVNGYFFNLGNFAYFWSSTEINATRALKRVLYHDYNNMSHFSYGKDYGFSVRCIKD